ncbi:hypothetical protein BCR33DRAFT_848860 [Rhizoclosmatium globosum]|uniref:Uncharacterized protein n=1 Tax=Rhizoclosmatium globosum TaxID=329046 RepID=A0A1Y2CIR3_9FUNG|nr:hypothetical protein BCR33DRAFT_848860 [Rhizoclosmatium globosum]|eukprot:ORY46797.1 hypothetical protein BCR33DRAFT_848860 [Rhizoclosmatium globosum]
MSQPNRSASLRRTGSLRAFFSAKARQTAASDTVDQPVQPTRSINQLSHSTLQFNATPSAKLERKPTGMKKFMQMFKKDEDYQRYVTPLPLPESQPESQTYVREELGQLLEEESVVAEAQTSEPKTDPDSDSLHSVDSAHDATSEPYQNLLSRRYSYTSLFGTIAQPTSIASSISEPNSKSDAEENSDSNNPQLINAPIIAPSPTISFENIPTAPRRGSIPSIARVHLLSTYSEVLDDIDNILDSEDDILERFQEQQEVVIAGGRRRLLSVFDVFVGWIELEGVAVDDTASVVEEESEVDDEAGEMPVMKAVDMVDCVGP